ncbi:MAG: hypothetical protein H7331_09105 [Bacteroidia bacterium]|nr:hypothetical protein [Bacteroidia bacterium]
MKAQPIYIVHPQSPDQISAFEAVMNLLKIQFEKATKDKPYNTEYVDMIKQADKDIKNGKGKKMSMTEFQNLCK